MSDDPTLPSSWEGHDGEDEDLALERDLRAAFAPVPAPRDFRERLKADLLHGDERLVLLSATSASRQRFPRRMVGVIDAVATHPRALAAATLAVAAAILLALALNANNFGGHTYTSALPPHSTSSPRPTRTSAATATPPHPTVTATPRATPTATAQPVLAPPRPTATTKPAPSTPTSAAPTTRPQAAATRVIVTAQPTPSATPVSDSGQTATPSPIPATATVVATPPRATATLKPVVVVQRVIAPTPARPAPTATPIPPTSTAIPTATPIPSTATAIPTPPPPAVSLPSPAPVNKRRAKAPALHAKKHLAHTASPTRTPLPAATETPVRRPTIALTVRVVATATSQPTNTPRPTATLRPTATATPTVAPMATATPTVAPTATASLTPVPTASSHNVLIPASRQSFLLPSADNTTLNSPLQDGLTTDAIQGISFTAPQTWTPPQLTSPYLPVYPIARVPVTTTDLMTVTHELGARDVSDITMQGDGGITAQIQVDSAPYTLTVYAGYGTPRFTLHALASEPGTLSSVRLTAQASAWLQYHGNLLHSDMRTLPPSSGVLTYSQTMSDTAILGPVALSLSFDGRGALRDLSYNYIVPNAPILAPAQSSIIAASTAILTYDGQALYVGPQPSTATGPAMVSGLTLAYVGVRDVKNDYLEPVYVLNGAVGSATGPQPFNLYISALAPPPVPTSTTGP